MAKSILVIGATGKQGGAVVKHLLDAETDFDILAVTRSASSPPAQNLAEKSTRIRIIEGNLDNPSLLFQAAEELTTGSLWGVYFVQNPLASRQTPDQEVREAKAFIDQAIAYGVKHFMYSSVDRGGEKSWSNPTPVPHFFSKHEIEIYLRDRAKGTEMTWTILRPVGFMDNYVPGFQAKIFFIAWKVAVKGPFQLVAVNDIGHFAAQAFVHPQKYGTQAMTLVGDELTFNEAAEVFARETGRSIPTTFDFIASLILYFAKGIRIMFQWMADEGFGGNLEELRKEHSGLMDFGTYISRHSGYAEQ